jgi:hypothetical protein
LMNHHFHLSLLSLRRSVAFLKANNHIHFFASYHSYYGIYSSPVAHHLVY